MNEEMRHHQSPSYWNWIMCSYNKYLMEAAQTNQSISLKPGRGEGWAKWGLAEPLKGKHVLLLSEMTRRLTHCNTVGGGRGGSFTMRVSNEWVKCSASFQRGIQVWGHVTVSSTSLLQMQRVYLCCTRICQTSQTSRVASIWLIILSNKKIK